MADVIADEGVLPRVTPGASDAASYWGRQPKAAWAQTPDSVILRTRETPQFSPAPGGVDAMNNVISREPIPMPIMEAAVEASRRRLRPILMTSFAFILGVVPLAFASGAGAASRQALGTAVIGGILASTLIAILFVPVYYVLMVRLSRWWVGKKKKVGKEPITKVMGEEKAVQ